MVLVDPARRRQLRVYECGPDLSRPAHLGDLRTALLSDLIRRTAERRRLVVVVSQSSNDIGATDGVDGTEEGHAGKDHVDAFHADCTALGIRPPEFTPRLSESVGLATTLIEQLISSGHARPAEDGSACFSPGSFAGYGELSGRQDRQAVDWLLRRGASAVPAWSALCSAASRHDLGDVIDLHIGSASQRFPHQENERAQSDAAAGHEVVRHWADAERLLFDGHEMSGGLPGTPDAVVLADLSQRGLDPLALRLAFLDSHYRQPLDLTWPALAMADAALRRWRAQVAEWATHPSRPLSAEHAARVTDAFEDDLNTPAALRALRELADDADIPLGAKFETFAHVDQLLGLDLASEIGRAPAPAA